MVKVMGREDGMMADSNDDIRENFHKFVKQSCVNEERSGDWESVISIGTAARMVNLSVSALRKYEKEGLLIYHRSDSGRRLLSQADLKRIRIIQHMINEIGLNMEGIRRLLALLPCWELKPCSREDKKNCRAYLDPVGPCWMLAETECSRQGVDCRQCNVYRLGAYCTETMKSLLYHLDDMK